MGNKVARSKSMSDADDRDIRRRNKKNANMENQNGGRDRISCPDLGGAVPYNFQEEKGPEIKLYRSYGNLQHSRAPRNDDPDIKIYKRNSEGIQKYSTLPRSFGRPKSMPASAMVENGMVREYPELRRRSPASDSSGRDSRASKLASMASSQNSLAKAPVTPEDFPSTPEIKRKLKCFEDHFSRCLTDKYQTLPETVQLSALTIAIKTTPGAKDRFVSLYEYLNTETVPLNLKGNKQDGTEYILLVPEALLHGIKHVRRDKLSDVDLWTSLAADLVTCIAVEAANEIARMFEYQIALLAGDDAVRMLANHAADCVIAYIKYYSTYLDRNSAILGILRGYPPQINQSKPIYLSVVLGNRELKWELTQIFKKPGLRRELLLFMDDTELSSDFETDRSPWQFFTSADHDHSLYGFRGLLLEWDWVEKFYKVNTEDEFQFKMQVISGPDDFHRTYNPYRRLFGLDTMLRYGELNGNEQTGVSLAEFLNLAGEITSQRDEIQPAYRPLAPAVRSLDFGTCNLDNVDLTRAQLKRANLSRASVRNANFLLADATEADMSKIDEASATGAQLCYTTLTGANMEEDSLQGAKVRHVVMAQAEPKVVKKKKKKVPKKTSTSSMEDAPSSRASNGISSLDQTDSAPAPENTIPEIRVEPVEIQTQVSQDGETFVEPAQLLSDSQGNLVEVEQVIEKKQEQLKEKKKKKKKKSVGDASSPTDPNAPVVVDEYGVVVKPKRKVKRKPSEGSASGDKTPSPEIAAAQPETGAQPKRKGSKEKRKSRAPKTPDAESPPSSAPAPVPVKEHVTVQHVTTVRSARPPGTLPRYLGSNIPEEPPSSPGKSLSTTNIHRVPNRGSPTDRPGSGAFYPSRMSKSVSLHGTLPSAGKGSLSPDGFTMGFMPAKRIYQLSKEEIEFITKSQIFSIMKGLQIPDIASNLPEPDELMCGREAETEAVVDLLSASGRIVTLAGCYGYGKSSIALAAGRELNKKFIQPVWINLHGCVSTSSVYRRILSIFGLNFRQKESQLFYNWVNSHEQRLLFILDNIDLSPEEDNKLSDLLDDIVTNVKNLRVLCTGRRHFYKGHVSHELYRVGRLNVDSSKELLRVLSPDLHDEGIDHLLDSACQNPFLLKVVAKTCMMEDVDSGKLFEEITEGSGHVLLDRVEDVLYDVMEDELELQNLLNIACCLLKIMDNIPLAHAEALLKASYFAAYFDLNTLSAFIEGKDDGSLEFCLKELVTVGLLLTAPDDPDRYKLPLFVRIVAQSKMADDGSSATEYCKHIIENLKMTCANYFSLQCEAANKVFNDNYDNIVDVLNRIIEREEVYEFCPTFSCMEFAKFLGELLPEDIYVNLFELLAQQAEDNKDISKQSRALCCLSHKYIVEGNYLSAKHAAEKAYEVVHDNSETIRDTDRAYCLQCLGRTYWEDKQDPVKSTNLVKSALEIYKIAIGSRHLQTLFTNEMYSWMLTQRDNHQMARHYFNISDLFVKEQMDANPLLIDGYNCRRSIWDRLSLFQRATDTARKAADIAKLYYGDHPVTATMLSHLCDSIIKRGSLNDAIKAGIGCLSIRMKILGDHVDTGLAYKTLAYLMLRSGQYDEATRFGQSALDIFDRLDANERYKIDVKNSMAQARYRLQCKSSVFVEIQPKDSSKNSLKKGGSTGMVKSKSISTEV